MGCLHVEGAFRLTLDIFDKTCCRDVKALLKVLHFKMSLFFSLKRYLLSTGNHFRGHYLHGTCICGSIRVCFRACHHNSYWYCFYYDQGNHHHQIPVVMIHSQSLTFFVCFISEKEGCERVEMAHFQLLLSSCIKHNRFPEQRRNVKGKSKRNHSLKTNSK